MWRPFQLKISEISNKTRQIMPLHYQKFRNVTKIRWKICLVYVENAVSEYWWFVLFQFREFDCHDSASFWWPNSQDAQNKFWNWSWRHIRWTLLLKKKKNYLLFNLVSYKKMWTHHFLKMVCPFFSISIILVNMPAISRLTLALSSSRILELLK